MKDTIHKYRDGISHPPVPPGETLAEEMAARGLTANALSLKLRVPANRLTAIVHGERAITAETALRLGRYFGTGAMFWMNLQARYELAIAERDSGKKIASEVQAA